MSSLISRILSKASGRVFLFSFFCAYTKVVLFVAVAVVLVASTTVVVGREWTATPDGAPAPEWHTGDTAGFEIAEDNMDDKDEEGTEGGENSNVLHLLYTIAQVLPLLLIVCSL